MEMHDEGQFLSLSQGIAAKVLGQKKAGQTGDGELSIAFSVGVANGRVSAFLRRHTTYEISLPHHAVKITM